MFKEMFFEVDRFDYKYDGLFESSKCVFVDLYLKDLEQNWFMKNNMYVVLVIVDLNYEKKEVYLNRIDVYYK